MTQFATLMLGASMMLGPPANAASVAAQLGFTDATLANDGTASGTFIYLYDPLTNVVVGGDASRDHRVPDLANSAYASQTLSTAGTAPSGFPAFGWTLNKSGVATNLSAVEAFSLGNNRNEVRFIVEGQGTRFAAVVHFSGVGTNAKLISGDFTGSGFADTKFSTFETTVGALGAGIAREPASWMMLIAGLSIIGAARRRQRSAVVAT